jgi:DnaJ-class molecular chaperone
MFIDYYAVLEIEETASFEQVKSAFKKQALKWHPDRNIGMDTKIKMQEINEDYVLLKDTT